MRVSEGFRAQGKSDQAKGAERLAHGHVVYGDGYYAGNWQKKGLLSEEEASQLEQAACPGIGSCQGLYTANTMACLTEAMGMSLPGCGTALAVSAKKRRIAYASGERIVELVKEDVKPRQILTRGRVPQCHSRGQRVGRIEQYRAAPARDRA